MIRDGRQIVALASPVRLALVDALEGIGPSSVAELARIVGMPPDGLYYHLRILEKRGLVKRRGDSVDVTARPLLLHYEAADAKNRSAITRVVAAMLRGALRMFRSAFKDRVRVSGKRRELWAAQRTARLSSAQLERVNRLLNALLETLGQRDQDENDKLYSVTFVLSPLE